MDQKQAVVDNYLEFLDRRYQRLHEEEEPRRDTKFSAWKWLTQGSDDSEPLKQQKTDDALYVLGVAGLASEKLLQKHQLPVPESKQQRQEASASMATRGLVMDLPWLLRLSLPRSLAPFR